MVWNHRLRLDIGAGGLMALNANTLSGLIKAGLLSGGTGAVDNAALEAMCQAIAAAVVSHITAAGVVTVNGVAPPGGGPVVSVGGVT